MFFLRKPGAVGVSSYYNAEMSGNAAEGYVLTASHTTAVADIPVSVSWNDTDDQDGIRPAQPDLKARIPFLSFHHTLTATSA